MSLNFLPLRFSAKCSAADVKIMYGINISAKIADPSFYELIDKGEAFAKGDILEVELQINQKFDESVNTFVTKSY